jgi:ABC-2 type transport system ATP-binding protein
MKQRLGLAGALLVPRKLVVLDEPTNGLDPAGTRDVRRIIGELHAGGATVIVSSHLLAEVEATCTHVAVLQSGSLVAAGELRSLLDAGTGGLVVVTPDVDLALTTLRDAGATAFRDAGAEPAVVVSDGPAAPEIVALLVRAGVAVHEVRRRRPRLEELFAQLTEGSS